MHDQDIKSRTQLKLDSETEHQALELEDLEWDANKKEKSSLNKLNILDIIDKNTPNSYAFPHLCILFLLSRPINDSKVYRQLADKGAIEKLFQIFKSLVDDICFETYLSSEQQQK